MENNPTDQSTQMRQLLMVLLFRLLFFQAKDQNKLTVFSLLTSPLSHLVLKQLVVLWQFLFQEIPLSQQRNLKPSQLMLTINLESWFKYFKVKDKWPKIITYLESSILMVFHQPQEVFLKSRFHSKSIKTVLWVLMPQIKEHLDQRRLPLQITRVDSQKTKFKSLLSKQKNTRTKIKRSERESKPRTPLRAIVSVLNTLLMIRSLKTKSLLEINRQLNQKLNKLKDGWAQTLKLKHLHSKQNKRNLKMFSTQ